MIRLAAGLFILFSGVSGLVYEIVWSKLLLLVFGNTAHAHAVVLAVFLGGLALGNELLGPRADSVKNPLRLYGFLELGAAAAAVLVPKLLLGVSAMFEAAAREGRLEAGPLAGLRMTLSLCVLLVPTFLLGGTLPALSRFLTTSFSQFGASVSWLYFLNTAGAAAGALWAAFGLIPSLGLELAGSVAALINACVGIAALILSRRPPSPAAKPPAEEAVPRTLDPARERILLAAVFAAGFVSLAYQIAWIRLFALIVGSSSYAFALMVSAFISGIALGSLAVRLWPRARADAYFSFGVCQLAAGACVLLSFPVYAGIPYLFHQLQSLLTRQPAAFTVYQAASFLFCFCLMLLPTAFIGASLPLATAAAAKSLRSAGAAVGRVFALNTLGNVLGALAAGLFLLRALGLQSLLEAGAAVNIAVGAAVLWTARTWDRRGRLACAVLGAGLLLVHIAASKSWDRRALTRGEFRFNNGQRMSTAAEYAGELDQLEILYYQDGANTTVTVTEKTGGLRQLRVNGKVDASTGLPDMRTQVLLGQMPVLLKPDAEDALVIGFGSGVTAAALLTHPLKSVVVAEIAPEVLEAAPLFSEVNGRAWEDERFRAYAKDGRTVLKTTPRTFDLIISEPSNPWIAGIADLYSKQFFEEALSRLKPGGIMTQWVHTYEMDDETLLLILRTAAAVFPHLELWTISSDVLIIGSNAPIEHDFKAMARALSRPEAARQLKKIGVERLTTLLAMHSGDDALVRDLVGESKRLNEDLFPVLEYQAPKAFFIGASSSILEREDLRLRHDGARRLALGRFLTERGRTASADELFELSEYLQLSPGPLGGRLMREFHERFPEDERAQWAMAKAALRAGQLRRAQPIMNSLLKKRPNSIDYLDAAAEMESSLYINERTMMSPGEPGRALKLLSRLAELAPERRAGFYQRIGLLLEQAGDYTASSKALEAAAEAAQADPSAQGFSRQLLGRAARMAEMAKNAEK